MRKSPASVSSAWLIARSLWRCRSWPTQIGELLDELHKQDPTIARTIFNVALDAAEPIPPAQRYLREFHQLVAHLKTLDPAIARTIANATFMARMPESTATARYNRFASLFPPFTTTSHSRGRRPSLPAVPVIPSGRHSE